MKKLLYFIFGLFFSLITLIPSNVYALDSAVKFEGGADNFVFLPGTAWSLTDLFDELKNAMPGDRLVEEIEVRNNAAEWDHVKIYMRAEAHDEEANPLETLVAESETVASMSDFLSQLTLKIYNESELLYSGPAHQTSGLDENVLLGDFKKGDNKMLRAELEVPISLSNDYMYRSGEIDWIFVAEGFKDPLAADTGENTKNGEFLASTYSTLFVVGILAMAFIMVPFVKKYKK